MTATTPAPETTLPTAREQLLNRIQKNIPIVQRPYQVIAEEVGMSEDEALEILRAHSWPGNVRELQGVVKFALIQAKGEVLTPDCLPPVLLSPQAAAAGSAEGQAGQRAPAAETAPVAETVPAAVAFVLFGLGFLRPGQSARIFTSPSWLRVSTAAGHVLTRRRQARQAQQQVPPARA